MRAWAFFFLVRVNGVSARASEREGACAREGLFVCPRQWGQCAISRPGRSAKQRVLGFCGSDLKVSFFMWFYLLFDVVVYKQILALLMILAILVVYCMDWSDHISFFLSRHIVPKTML